VIVAGQEVFVFHEMLFTMTDGKVCNAITSTSSAQVCYVCAASPKEMNAIDDTVRRPVNTTAFKFGLSTLDAWIRIFEYFLRVAYRLDIKKWQMCNHIADFIVRPYNKSRSIRLLCQEDSNLLAKRVTLELPASDCA
jgi:hypothetical protein